MSSFNESSVQEPPAVLKMLKEVDQWNFPIFELDEISNGNALRHIGHCLIRTHGLISKLRVSYKLHNGLIITKIVIPIYKSYIIVMTVCELL